MCSAEHTHLRVILNDCILGNLQWAGNARKVYDRRVVSIVTMDTKYGECDILNTRECTVLAVSTPEPIQHTPNPTPEPFVSSQIFVHETHEALSSDLQLATVKAVLFFITLVHAFHATGQCISVTGNRTLFLCVCLHLFSSIPLRSHLPAVCRHSNSASRARERGRALLLQAINLTPNHTILTNHFRPTFI